MNTVRVKKVAGEMSYAEHMLLTVIASDKGNGVGGGLPEEYEECGAPRVCLPRWLKQSGATNDDWISLRRKGAVIFAATDKECFLTALGFEVLKITTAQAEKGELKMVAKKVPSRKTAAKKVAAKKAPAKKVAAKKAPVKKEAAKKAPAKKEAAEKRHGIAKPREGCTCANLWAVLDKLTAKKKAAPTRKECMAAAIEAGFNPSTASVQYRRWALYNDCHKVKE
jgi:hypothetical protein